MGYHVANKLVAQTGTVFYGRVISEKGVIGEIRYGYNSAGQLSAKTCMLEGKEFKTEYSYDDLGRVVKVASPAGKYVYSYDAKVRIATLSFGNVKIKNDYDKVGRLTSRKMNDMVLCSYEYDKLNRRIKAEVNGVTWLYKYDIKGQLVSASSSDGKSYGYAFDLSDCARCKKMSLNRIGNEADKSC